MTENEAIKNVTAYVYMECENMPPQVIKALNIMKDATKEIQSYREIGTVEECRVAVERMKPKKPIVIDRRFHNGNEVCTDWKCPVCGLNVIEEPPCQEYCQRCGNKIDWN